MQIINNTKRNIMSIYSLLFSSDSGTGTFEFLDGFRGVLALWVLIHHLLLEGDLKYFDLTGYFIGVVGFFNLSSFLLTYRLLCQFNETTDNDLKKSSLITIKYLIRRFFRIYVPFVFFVFLIFFVSRKFGGFYKFENSFFMIISLQSAGYTHLWTIAPEIKYYFFIPLFTFITYKLKSIWYIWDIFLIVSLYYIEYYKILSKHVSVNFDLASGYLFYTGSILAVIYYHFKNSFLFKYSNNNHFKLASGIIAMALYMKGMVLWSVVYNPKLTNFNDYTFKAGLYWGIVMIIMIIGSPNFFTNYFISKFLKYGGKFSFGIYLFHPMCIIYVRAYLAPFKNQFELIFYTVIASYFAGFLFFYLVENISMKLGKYLCSKVYLNVNLVPKFLEKIKAQI